MNLKEKGQSRFTYIFVCNLFFWCGNNDLLGIAAGSYRNIQLLLLPDFLYTSDAIPSRSLLYIPYKVDLQVLWTLLGNEIVTDTTLTAIVAVLNK